jgi:glutathione-regulated potassium-efflux system ancillary protein KefG
MKILILFAHPAFHKSHVNKLLIEGLDGHNNVTIHDLYEEYPDFDIDIKREQELLSQHDCIIFHYPLFWYSTPALLKEWQDLVFEHGWAFGSQGNALKDKLYFNTITTGGPKNAYTGEGLHKHTIKELLAPQTQTANQCKMIPLPPFVVYGTLDIDIPEIMENKRIYSELLRQISTNELVVERALNFDSLNDCITQKLN